MSLYRIAVLMSTYNGESYLKSQLFSLLDQEIPEGAEYQIHIRDDNSKDNTYEILMSFKEKHKNINIHVGPNNIGAKQSFLYMVRNVEADYYFFCDQDDVWHSDKIAVSISSLKDIKKPAIFFSNLNLVDENGCDMGVTFWEHQRINPTLFDDKNNFLYNSLVTGCTVSFNRQLRDSFVSLGVPWHKLFYHDHMLAILASKIGVVTFSEACLVDYRQHSNNVVGSKEFSFTSKIKVMLFYFSNLSALSIILSWFNISIQKYFYKKMLLWLKRFK
ncbi:glycosyltransferase family 2 protein [Aeromonas veronii]|uniref:glycosyltransferase family 2 protein n=1 Tax=Aeromonas veronii TaxID=654 RepID=UPI0030053FCA